MLVTRIQRNLNMDSSEAADQTHIFSVNLETRSLTGHKDFGERLKFKYTREDLDKPQWDIFQGLRNEWMKQLLSNNLGLIPTIIIIPYCSPDLSLELDLNDFV